MSVKQNALQWTAHKTAEFFSRHPVWFFAIAFIYILLPIDFFPEAFIGPLGFIDDVLVLLLPLILRQYSRRNKPPKTYYDTTAQ